MLGGFTSPPRRAFFISEGQCQESRGECANMQGVTQSLPINRDIARGTDMSTNKTQESQSTTGKSTEDSGNIYAQPILRQTPIVRHAVVRQRKYIIGHR